VGPGLPEEVYGESVSGVRKQKKIEFRSIDIRK